MSLGDHLSASKIHEVTGKENYSEGKDQAGSQLPHEAALPGR